MKYFKMVLLTLVVFTCTIFTGCSQKNADNTKIITKNEYCKEVRAITKTIFEDENYTNKDEVLAFSKDMERKSKDDKESNSWYYSDQLYLITVKNMYLDLFNKISNLNCTDGNVANTHKNLIAQLQDLTQTTSTLLQEYSNNPDPKLLNSSIPAIKLIFTDNPNEYTVSEIAINEIDGRINRINNSIEGLASVKAKEISKVALNVSNDKGKTQVEKKEVANVDNTQSNIDKARELVYQATGESKSEVVVEYISNPGTYVDSNKYYVFSMSARDGSFVSDVDYVVDKNTFQVYTCDPYGDISKIESGQQPVKDATSNSSNVNSNQISGGISCKKALEKINAAYVPTYQYNGSPNGEISYEMFNYSEERLEEPAYVFGFDNIETGDEYVGWVYGDGDYMMRCIEY